MCHDSYDNVKTKWYPEVRQICPSVPIILAGTKLDLRTDPEAMQDLAQFGKKPITQMQGFSLANNINAG